jgi:CDP-glycerol glycerophosphotransferase (TagB/SpsB family)
MKTSYPVQWLYGIISLFYPLLPGLNRQKVVLTSFHCDGYRGNTKVLFEKLINHPYLKPVWLSRNHEIVSRINQLYGDERAVLAHSLRGLRELATANFILFTHGTSDFPFLKLPGRALKIQTYHGLPTKRGEYMRPKSDKRPNIIQRLILWYRFRSINYFLSSSPHVTKIFSQRFSIPRQNFLETGYPCYDKVIHGKPDTELIKEAWPDAPEFGKVILYAPTFRKLKKTKWFPFNDYNPEVIAGFLESKKYLLLLRSHPNEKLEMDAFRKYSFRILDASQNRIENIYDLLLLTDLIVTDYSSVFIEGVLKDIPSLFLPYDLDTYERGLAFNYNEWVPGSIVTSQKQFIEEIQHSLNNKNRNREKRAKLRNRFFSAADGKSTERVIHFLEKNIIR